MRNGTPSRRDCLAEVSLFIRSQDFGATLAKVLFFSLESCLRVWISAICTHTRSVTQRQP